MATFAFSGRTRSGENVSGERIGDTMDAVVAALRREQILVTRIQPAQAKAGAVAQARKLKAKSVPAKNLAVFTRQFSVMIDAGLPLVQCLDILGNQEEHKYFAQVILQTRTDVEGGTSLADAMKSHPKVLRRAVLQHDRGRRSGRYSRHDSEAAGDLHRKGRQAEGPGQVGDDLSDRRHRDRRVVVGVILWKVIPTFATLFAGLGAELPLPTRIVIALSNNLVRFMPFLIIGGFARRLGLQDLLRDREGPARDRRDHAEAADPRADPAQDRRGAVLPHAVDADGVGRADSRRPRHHRARPRATPSSKTPS